MADIYDDQFRRRATMHLLVCDPVSAEIIASLSRYLQKAEAALANSLSPDQQAAAADEIARLQQSGEERGLQLREHIVLAILQKHAAKGKQ